MENNPHGVYGVFEKIHGANFAFYCDPETLEVRVASRNNFVLTEQFYNSQRVVDRYKTKIRDLVATLSLTNTVVFFGELFGGSFPNDKINGISKVQSGVYYSPDLEWMCFDVAVIREGELEFLPYDFYAGRLMGHGIPFIPCIYKTQKLDFALDYDIEFNSLIPGMLGFPEIQDNICEGVVIKNILGESVPSDSSRHILKKKNEKFKEKVKKVRKKDQKSFVDKELENRYCGIIECALDNMSEQRMRNVLSHIGDQIKEPKHFGILAKNYAGEVIEEILKDYPEIKEDKDAMTLLGKFVGVEVPKVIRPHFLNILDGGF